MPVPSRSIRSQKTLSGSEQGAVGAQMIVDLVVVMEPGVQSVVGLEDVLPRTDITAPLAPIIAELSDSSWKVRKEAMDKIQDMMARSGNRIKFSNSTTSTYMVGVSSNRRFLLRAKG